MRCPIETGESTELFLAYGARKLGAEGTVAFERHLKVCPACSELAALQRAVWDALDVWEIGPVAAAEFDRRLFQRMEKEGSWWDRVIRPFRPLWVRPLLVRQGLPAAAAAGLLIFGAVWLQRPAGLPQTPVSTQVNVVAPDQADHTLEEMELMREFNGVVQAAEPKL